MSRIDDLIEEKKKIWGNKPADSYDFSTECADCSGGQCEKYEKKEA